MHTKKKFFSVDFVVAVVKHSLFLSQHFHIFVEHAIIMLFSTLFNCIDKFNAEMMCSGASLLFFSLNNIFCGTFRLESYLLF